MPTAVNMQPTTTTKGGTSSMLMALPAGQKAISTQRVVATESRSWRASSAPACRHMRP